MVLTRLRVLLEREDNRAHNYSGTQRRRTGVTVIITINVDLRAESGVVYKYSLSLVSSAGINYESDRSPFISLWIL